MSNPTTWRVEAEGLTHVGMKREQNEDDFILVPEIDLFLVADGMGGHNSGEIASQLATKTITNFVKATLKDDDITWPFSLEKKRTLAENRLAIAAKLANERIWHQSRRNNLYLGMGTTLVGLHMIEDKVHVINVGDSRCYRLRRGKLEQITIDHSLLNSMLQLHRIRPEDAANFPHKNVIMRALGIQATVRPDVFTLEPEEGDLFLLCSDGLTDLVKDFEIKGVLENSPSLAQALKNLVRFANQRGGKDNITVVTIRLVRNGGEQVFVSPNNEEETPLEND